MSNTILVVDDQSSVRQLLQEYLTKQGYRVITAMDGQTAIYTARHEQPDLILLDIMMPEMDGYQFLRQYRKERQTPVIILTAKEEETDAVVGVGAGRGRLCDQALPHARAPGPHPRGPSPQRGKSGQSLKSSHRRNRPG